MNWDSETSPPEPASNRVDLPARIGATLEIILVGIAGFVVIPVALAVFGVGTREILSNSKYLVLLLCLEATLTLILVWVLLRFHHQQMKYIGWNWGPGVAKEVALGVASLPVLFLATLGTKVFFQTFYPDLVTEENPLLELVDTPFDLFLLIGTSLYVGGIKEEVQRAFVLLRFQDYLGGIWVGLLLWTLFFAYGHAIQGVDNAAGAGVLGLIFGFFFIWRRRLIAPVVAHTLYNVTTVVSYWILVEQG